ncbi:hypothetical protein GALMADRAFT_104178 [Galerina marginata CBS 339.88]|uniref:CHAT domain-containing protein n=1 Tax=Galerina marginata (strain CBS 339.88) TaxID=685588 RepID=A0A067SE92_GALM3|nr:hypothetical protein GALMADRAFT_104178 [Galerina marginata CBS 339.88]
MPSLLGFDVSSFVSGAIHWAEVMGIRGREPLSPLTRVLPHGTTLYIENIVIDSDIEATTMKLQVFTADRVDGETLLLERTSSRQWKHNEPVDLTSDLTIIAKWDESNFFGRICFGETAEFQQWNNMLLDDDRFPLFALLSERPVIKFATETDNTELTLTFDIGAKSPSETIPYELDSFEGKRAQLDNAISIIQEAVNISEAGHPDMPSMLNELGGQYFYRFDLTGKLEDLDNAITSHEKAISLTQDSHADMPRTLDTLAHLYQSRFKKTGSLTDISKAISFEQRSIDLAPVTHKKLHLGLINAAILFRSRFMQTKNLDDLSEAISLGQKAVDLSPLDNTDLPTWLRSLATWYRSRSRRTGNLSDISEAISCANKAVSLTPMGRADMAAHLHCLGLAYQSRFDILGNPADLSLAILQLQKAAHLTPEGHNDMAIFLSNLGLSYQSRFEQTGNRADLSDAISFKQRGLHLTPPGHAHLPKEFSNLGTSYESRFKSTGNLEDLSQAIVYKQKSLELTVEGDTQKPLRLNNLGSAYQSRFRKTEDLADISEAISCSQKAIQLTPEGHPTQPMLLNNLGNAYEYRFESTHNLDDLSEAIACREKAIILTPEGHASRLIWLANLGHTFEIRFKHSGNYNDLDAVASYYSMAAKYSSGRPTFKLVASMRLASISKELRPSKSLEAYSTAIRLLSQVAGLEETVERRHMNLLAISDLSNSAAACAFECGRLDLALEWLEQGRCLVWNQLNSLRTPIDALRAEYPDLANDIVRVSRALESAGLRFEGGEDLTEDSHTMENKISLQDEVNSHIALAQEWDSLIAKVHTLPGFEELFQLPSSSTILQHLPKAGYLIFVNVHEDRCDALAIRSGDDQLIHIPLPEFSSVKAAALRNGLQDRLNTSGIRMREAEPLTRGMRLERNAGMKDILGELWLLVVKPILDGLEYSKHLSGPNRIWWCATGSLAFLPIHAAGIYDESGPVVGSTLSDFAISSYTPTVQALGNSLKVPRILNDKKAGLLLISQPATPGLSRIPKTTEEVRAIQNLTKAHLSRVLCLEGEDATVIRTRTEMEAHSFVHFACHASQDTKQPLKSGFALHDNRLELSSIIGKRLVGVDFAFLSACQTSAGDEKLSEEAVHLAAGMLAAGYRGVVATMWSIRDLYAPEVAEYFYSNLLDGLETLNGENAARALHDAMQKFRRKLAIDGLDLESSLLVWVPYVHFGL